MFSQTSVCPQGAEGKYLPYGWVLIPQVCTHPLWWILTRPGVHSHPPPPIHGPGILRDTVDKWVVRILLECLLVQYKNSKRLIAMHFLDIHFDCSRKLVISFHFVFPCCTFASWYLTFGLFVAYVGLGGAGTPNVSTRL